ncbi:MAG: hypothetical protein Q9184_004892 [Pyrenodesmia sp. 2 TL-2023]
MLDKVQVAYTPYQKETVKDSKNVSHNIVGRVDLRWHKQNIGKSYPETFYVDDQKTPLVILGKSAIETSNQPAAGKVHPVSVNQQTGAEKSDLERRQKEAAERRVLEAKEQEKQEAAKRQQESQTK